MVTANMQIREDGLFTSPYDEPRRYPYSALILFDYRRRAAVRLATATEARQYFAAFNPDLTGGCPPGRIGHGVPVF